MRRKEQSQEEGSLDGKGGSRGKKRRRMGKREGNLQHTPSTSRQLSPLWEVMWVEPLEWVESFGWVEPLGWVESLGWVEPLGWVESLG